MTYVLRTGPVRIRSAADAVTPGYGANRDRGPVATAFGPDSAHVFAVLALFSAREDATVPLPTAGIR